jgi:hypothetical protein
MGMPDHGDPIAYPVLAEGTPVLTSDGHEIGTVRKVLAETSIDIFDGINIDTPDGERFVDAPEIDSIYERAVILTLDHHAAAELSEPTAAPPVIDVEPLDPRNAGGGGAVRP